MLKIIRVHYVWIYVAYIAINNKETKTHLLKDSGGN